MNFIRYRESNVPFSLHDSRILQIEINETTLTLKLDRIFQYADDEEKWYQGIIEFTKTDIEECDIMVVHRPYGYDGEKSFTGETLSFDEFQKRNPDADFEIVTEGYSRYDTTFQGWIWQGENDPIFGIMRIWNTGDIIYRI
ncbi:hypothetical protein [Sharpea porci]|uniref:hypothetical protein n=1 Tax=Sharpea porci TaxID=2652286 RepID=UPI002A915EDF|nr:hypothetical protein [Sharpea porci]MDY5279145.1 hypothetical protein [Sharpea porci]